MSVSAAESLSPVSTSSLNSDAEKLAKNNKSLKDLFGYKKHLDKITSVALSIVKFFSLKVALRVVKYSCIGVVALFFRSGLNERSDEKFVAVAILIAGISFSRMFHPTEAKNDQIKVENGAKVPFLCLKGDSEDETIDSVLKDINTRKNPIFNKKELKLFLHRGGTFNFISQPDMMGENKIVISRSHIYSDYSDDENDKSEIVENVFNKKHERLSNVSLEKNNLGFWKAVAQALPPYVAHLDKNHHLIVFEDSLFSLKLFLDRDDLNLRKVTISFILFIHLDNQLERRELLAEVD